VIVAYIDCYRDGFGVEPICRVLTEHGVQIAPSTYRAAVQAPVSASDLADAYLANEVVDCFRANRSVYGVRKLWHQLRRAGHDVGRDQVGRLMRIAGIEGVVRGAHRTRTTRRDAAAPRHPDLLDRAWDTPTGPDQLVGRRLQLRVDAGRVLLRRAAHRRVLAADPRLAGHHVQDHTAGAVHPGAGAVHPAQGRRPVRPDGLVHHSDAGSQYTSIAFTDALIEAGIAGSIGSVGDALDNALMESTIGLYKTELIDRHDRSWTGRAEIETETAAWVHWYNTTRLHSAIGYLPPVAYEAAWTASHEQEQAA